MADGGGLGWWRGAVTRSLSRHTGCQIKMTEDKEELRSLQRLPLEINHRKVSDEAFVDVSHSSTVRFAHKWQFPSEEWMKKMTQRLITCSISCILTVCIYRCICQAKYIGERRKMVPMDTPLDHINLHIRGGYVVPWQKAENNTFYRYMLTYLHVNIMCV